MRWILPLCALLFMWVAAPVAQANLVEPVYQKVEYQQQRPLNWYYPYEYRYYTPHRTTASSNGCYWIYNNGTYVYTCS